MPDEKRKWKTSALGLTLWKFCDHVDNKTLKCMLKKTKICILEKIVKNKLTQNNKKPKSNSPLLFPLLASLFNFWNLFDSKVSCCSYVRNNNQR